MAGQLPNTCPSCAADMRVVRLDCPNCDTSVSGMYALPELARLSSDDQDFATAFVLSGGSLKELARRYGVSYPTVRNRLDELIARIREDREVVAAAGAHRAGNGGKPGGDEAEEGG